eukprot:gene21546-25912_t
MARLVPATQHKLLLYFHTWFVTKVSEYGFAAMAMFYDFFILSMEADDSVSFKMGSYSDTFAAYIVETNVKPQGGGGSAGGGKRSKWTWERQQQQGMPGSSEVEPAGAGAAAAGGERDLSSDGGSGSDELPQEEDQFGDLSALEGELLWLDLGETEDVGGARQGDEKQDDDRWWRGL